MENSFEKEGVWGEGSSNQEVSQISRGRALTLLILGILIGALIKFESLGRITMGFEDYRIRDLKSDYSLRVPEEDEEEINEEDTGVEEDGNDADLEEEVKPEEVIEDGEA